MCAGSFHGTRTSGTVLVVEMPCSIVTIVWYSIMPCCMSTTRESQPACAMTSAEKLEGTPSQLFTTALPSAQICLMRFSRAMTTLHSAALTLGRDPASYTARSQAACPIVPKLLQRFGRRLSPRPMTDRHDLRRLGRSRAPIRRAAERIRPEPVWPGGTPGARPYEHQYRPDERHKKNEAPPAAAIDVMQPAYQHRQRRDQQQQHADRVEKTAAGRGVDDAGDHVHEQRKQHKKPVFGARRAAAELKILGKADDDRAGERARPLDRG